MARVRYGIAKALEEEADIFIARSLAAETTAAGRSDILTAWKQTQRQRREVYTQAGVPDSAIRIGMYHRRANTVNPHLNSREGVSAPLRYRSAEQSGYSSLCDFVESIFDSKTSSD